jgi:hypothetical protein
MNEVEAKEQDHDITNDVKENEQGNDLEDESHIENRTQDNGAEAGTKVGSQNRDRKRETVSEGKPDIVDTENTGVDEVAGVSDNPPLVETVEDDIQEDMDAKYGERNGRHNLRPRKKPNEKYLKAIRPQDHSELHATLEHYAMTQYSVKKGLQLYGEAGKEAVFSEMQQLHEMEVIEPKMAHMLTRQEKQAALHYLMFLKKKRCGRIKGRGCADGRKQRLYKTKQETSAPTVAIESMFLTSTIDAKERRYVVTTDVPGAFMQTDIDELIHVKLEGPLVSLLAKVDPNLYEKYVATERGRPVLYVKLMKALYGTLQAAMLFWKDLTGNLIKWGFEINPYDWCVANKMIDGKQCTIVWHVDDLKISHVDPEAVEGVLDLLNERYGKRSPLVTTRGKVHDYLGMTLDFSEDLKVKIIMKEYIEEMFDELDGDMDGVAATPAAALLFTINENATKLDGEASDLFHHYTAKLLFLSRRARPDIQTAVAFLTTRVKGPDVDDQKKLRRCIQYLRGSIDIVLTLEADDLHIIKWWVDASFAVHPDMKSHTGATMSMGKGSVYSSSTRQKLNTKSSTEAELVGVDDRMPQILWTRYFLEAQGYDVRENVVYQDNQSAMLLENNGRGSSSQRTRHINIRYFFVTDRIKANEVSVEYCPTGEMNGDFFTKPLQGSPYRKFRDRVMNIKS